MKWIESHFPRARVNRSYYRYYYSHYAYAPCPARRACVPVCGGERKEKLCSRRSRRCDSTLNCISILKWYFVFFKVYRLPAWPETGPNATIIVVPTYNTSENRIEKKKTRKMREKCLVYAKSWWHISLSFWPHFLSPSRCCCCWFAGRMAAPSPRHPSTGRRPRRRMKRKSVNCHPSGGNWSAGYLHLRDTQGF